MNSMARSVPAGCSHATRAHANTYLRTMPAPRPPCIRSCLRRAPRVQMAAAALSVQEQQGALRTLYPASKAFKQGYMKVSDIHEVYYEVWGNPDGKAAVVLHGGPGAGCYPKHSQFFDPAHYQVILLDQRGCGRSRPPGCLIQNTTADLVLDLETLRSTLLGPTTPWLILGGSWGSTLALAYSLAHPDQVAGVILRGVCLMRPEEVQWLFGGGVGRVLPLAWHKFLLHLDPLERKTPLLGYYSRLLSGDPAVQKAAASAWSEMEMSAGFSREERLLTWSNPAWAIDSPYPSAGPLPPPPQPPPPSSPPPLLTAEWARYSNIAGDGDLDVVAWQRELSEKATGWAGGPGLVPPGTSQALLTCHYCVHNAFLAQEPLLAGVHRIHHIPAIAIQGQLDLVCPPGTAYDLHLAWPPLELRLVPGAGHSMYHPRITHEIVQATDRMLRLPPSAWAPSVAPPAARAPPTPARLPEPAVAAAALASSTPQAEAGKSVRPAVRVGGARPAAAAPAVSAEPGSGAGATATPTPRGSRKGGRRKR